MRSSCCGLWRTGRLRGRLRFEQPSYHAGDTAVLLLDAHNKSFTDIAEVVVSTHPHRSRAHPPLVLLRSSVNPRTELPHPHGHRRGSMPLFMPRAALRAGGIKKKAVYPVCGRRRHWLDDGAARQACRQSSRGASCRGRRSGALRGGATVAKRTGPLSWGIRMELDREVSPTGRSAAAS